MNRVNYTGIFPVLVDCLTFSYHEYKFKELLLDGLATMFSDFDGIPLLPEALSLGVLSMASSGSWKTRSSEKLKCIVSAVYGVVSFCSVILVYSTDCQSDLLIGIESRIYP